MILRTCNSFFALSFVTVVAATTGCSGNGVKQGSAQRTHITGSAGIPDELTAILGHYQGSFTGYAWNGTDMVRSATWTEDVTFADPVVDEDTFHGVAHDHMTFAGGRTHDETWNEGFLRLPDGRVGDHYFDVHGVRVIEHLIAPNTYAMERDVTAAELAWSGFTTAVRGRQIMTKTVDDENGRSTERITQLTEVVYTDAAGARQRAQLMTMNGYHRRTP